MIPVSLEHLFERGLRACAAPLASAEHLPALVLASMCAAAECCGAIVVEGRRSAELQSARQQQPKCDRCAGRARRSCSRMNSSAPDQATPRRLPPPTPRISLQMPRPSPLAGGRNRGSGNGTIRLAHRAGACPRRTGHWACFSRHTGCPESAVAGCCGPRRNSVLDRASTGARFSSRSGCAPEFGPSPVCSSSADWIPFSKVILRPQEREAPGPGVRAGARCKWNKRGV